MKINKLGMLKFKYSGFTLIELMISIVIAMIILAAVLTMFVTMVKSNSDNMKAIRLNQDLRAAMSLITRNLRRAGANMKSADFAALPPYPVPPGTPVYPEPFAGIIIDDVEATENVDGVDDADDDNDCVLFFYDDPDVGSGTFNPATPAATPPYGYAPNDSLEYFGYRLGSDNGEIEVRVDGKDCNESGWQAITDLNSVTITDLDFNEPPPPSPVLPGVPSVRQITVTIEGQLTSDNTVSRRLTETINIRNN